MSGNRRSFISHDFVDFPSCQARQPFREWEAWEKCSRARQNLPFAWATTRWKQPSELNEVVIWTPEIGVTAAQNVVMLNSRFRIPMSSFS
jgi:hypothetical protein